MARAKNPTTIEHDGITEGVAAELNEVAQQASEHSHEIMAQYGEGLPYEQGRIVREAQFYMAQSAEAMLEAGKRLVILKEHEPHGDFTHIVESKLGLAERTARLMMQAAVKYSAPSWSQNGRRLPFWARANCLSL